MKLVNLIIGFCFLISGCGGGASSSAPAPIENQPNIEITSNSPTQESISSVDFDYFMRAIAITSYYRFGELVGYWHKNFDTINISSSTESVDNTSNTTKLKIIHPGHGAHDGDSVTISGVTAKINGIQPTSINGTHTISGKNSDEYFINISGMGTINSTNSFSATLKYKYIECSGHQSIAQYSSNTSENNFSFGTDQATRTTTVVKSELKNCSPQKSSFTTYKYYKNFHCISCNFFLGEEIVNGIYSVVETNLTPPQGALSPGDTGEIGTMSLYKDRTKLSKQGKTIISYEVQPSTAGALMVLKSKTYTVSNVLISEVKDYYAKIASAPSWSYSLIGSTIKYNNERMTEVSVKYYSDPIDVLPPTYAGTGTVHGKAGGNHNFKIIPISVADYELGGEIKIRIKIGNGNIGLVYFLLPSPTPEFSTNSANPTNFLISHENINPSTPSNTYVFTYKFPAESQKQYFLAIDGSPASSPSETNTYDYEIWVY